MDEIIKQITSQTIEIFSLIGSVLFMLIAKKIKSYITKKDVILWTDFLVYVVEQKHVYKLETHLQEIVNDLFRKRLNVFIDYHRKLNIDILLDLSKTVSIDREVSKNFEDAIIELLSDNRVRLKVIFPQLKTASENHKQLFEILNYHTLKKESISIVEDKYIEITEDRRK